MKHISSNSLNFLSWNRTSARFLIRISCTFFVIFTWVQVKLDVAMMQGIQPKIYFFWFLVKCSWITQILSYSVVECLASFWINQLGLIHHLNLFYSSDEEVKGNTNCLDCSIVVGFTLIFMVFYPTHMYITEVYFGTVKDIFPYMFIKYVVGCLHLIAVPTLVLFVKRDIRSPHFHIQITNIIYWHRN